MYHGTSLGGFFFVFIALMLAAAVVAYAILIALVFVCIVALCAGVVWVAHELADRGAKPLTEAEVAERLGYAGPPRFIDVG